MKIDVVTLFPKQISNFLNYSIIGRAVDQKKAEVACHDLRRWAVDKRGSVDDKPYGGGKGMILRVEPVVRALRELKKGDWGNKGNTGSRGSERKELTAIFDARGEVYSQKKAFEFAGLDRLILICGHYEGYDERIKNYVDCALSIGEFVLTGGEIPALTVIDSAVRLLPGVLKEGAVESESFSEEKGGKGIKESGENRQKEYPQYTRPEVFEGYRVPEVLLSGNHRKIEEWRKK